MKRHMVIAVYTTLSAVLVLSPLSSPEQPKTKPKPPQTITAQVHAEQVESTPKPTLEPETRPIEPVVTWQDNPNDCNQQTQWIAAEAPFECIEKPQPVQTVIQPTNVPNRPAVAPQRVSYGGSHQDWLAAAGIPSDVWSCADGLIMRESGWRVNATNPTSGAYGIPQALPGHKMASAGADWQTNPVTQLRWMASYVTKYGGWCEALAFQKANGWY